MTQPTTAAIDVARLQQRLGIVQDGSLGPATLRALFARCGAAPAIAGELSIAANVHFRTAGILASASRLAHALAQMGHESDGWRAMEEYASGAAYEGRPDLGNTQPGDGKRYKGRGPIQVTGRANYRRYGAMLGLDLEQRPDLASVPSIGMAVSCAYWTACGLNAFADADDLTGLTRRINGGTNGLDDRARRLAAARLLVA